MITVFDARRIIEALQREWFSIKGNAIMTTGYVLMKKEDFYKLENKIGDNDHDEAKRHLSQK